VLAGRFDFKGLAHTPFRPEKGHRPSMAETKSMTRSALPYPPPQYCFGGSQIENSYFADMCSGSEAGSYLRRIDFV